MFMDLHIRQVTKGVIAFISLFLLIGCTKIDESDLLIDHYQQLHETMIDALEEETKYQYEGKYFTVKLEQAFKYIYQEHPDQPVYVYSLIVIPKYNTKTVISSIQVESKEYKKELKQLYSECSYQKLEKELNTYNDIEDFRGKKYEYMIANSPKSYHYSLTDEQFEEAICNFNLIITINNKKDIINISNFTIDDYDKNIHHTMCIDQLEKRGYFSIHFDDYCKYPDF